MTFVQLVGVYDLKIEGIPLIGVTVRCAKSAGFTIVCQELRVDLTTKIFEGYGEIPGPTLSGYLMRYGEAMKLTEDGPLNCQWIRDISRRLYDCHTRSIYQLIFDDTYVSCFEFENTIYLFFQRNDYPLCPIHRYCHQGILRMRIFCTAGTTASTFWTENDFSPECDYSLFVNRICGHLIDGQHWSPQSAHLQEQGGDEPREF
jgi:hypothetical protein